MSGEGVTTQGLPEVRIASGSGSITVIGEPRDDIVADGRVELERAEAGVVKVTGKRSRSVTIHCPEGCDIVVGTRSGSLSFKGRLGAIRATTMSGHIQAAHVASADVRAMSGSIDVVACDGPCRVKTKSGSVHIGTAGSIEVSIGSGSITVDRVAGAARARTASGSVRIAAEGGGRVEAETMSGSITITLPRGCRPAVRARSFSSKADIGVPPGDDCEIVARTMSGGITVRSR